jgi:RimJ/RimL family protein N-acetyltransferase
MDALTCLAAPMGEGDVRLSRFEESDREELRVACAQDREVWAVYPYSMLDEHFDAGLDRRLASSDWVVFTIRRGDRVVGTSCYISVDPRHRTLEIGGTYYVPEERGTGLNRAVKQLLLSRAFACGFDRVQFNIDTRNGRSMRAVEKIGAMREGTLRRNRVTWTGYVRDTAVYSILREEWEARDGTLLEPAPPR